MNTAIRQLLVVGTVALALQPGGARADALVRTQAMKATTIAEIFIEGDQLRAEFEVGAPDVPAFANLMPDEIFVQLGRDPAPRELRLAAFSRDDFVIRADGGEPLAGRLVSMELKERIVRDDITGEPIPPAEGEQAEEVLTARLDYTLPGRPARLSFKPITDPENGMSAATIGFVVYHEGVAVNDFRYLGREETLALDWLDPWYSAFENRNLKRQYSAPAQAFIYVEPFEVRKEILIRPKDLQNWIDLGLEGKEVIAAGEHEALKAKVAEFLAGRCPMTVDGEPVEFEFDRIHFVERSLRKTTVLEEPEDLPLVSAVLGVIYSHRRDSLPKTAGMTWDLFNDKITEVSGATHDEAGPLPWKVDPDDPVLQWTNYLKNPTLPTFVALSPPPQHPRLQIPVLSAVCAALALLGLIVLATSKTASPKWLRVSVAGALLAGVATWPLARASLANPFAKRAPVSDEQATELITGLLRNVYGAFDYRDEEAVYDSLARSVSGDLLTEIYIDVQGALVLQGQGGAKVKVDTLEMLESEAEALPEGLGFTVRCRWDVGGKVNHWGHVHTRANQYEATFTVESVDGQWKITAQEYSDTKRLS